MKISWPLVYWIRIWGESKNYLLLHTPKVIWGLLAGVKNCWLMGPWDSLVGKCTCPQAWQLEFHVVVGWMRMSPIRPGVWKLGPQLLELFGGVACWRKNATGWVLRVYSFIPFPFCSVCITFDVTNVIAQILALNTSCHASLATVDYLCKCKPR